MVISYGSLMLMLTGACLMSSAFIWCAIRNFIELAIPFQPPQEILVTRYGNHWHLALYTGEIIHYKNPCN